MKGNIPIPDLPLGEEVWMSVVVTSVREGRTRQRRPFYEAAGRNPTGSVTLKIWSDAVERWKEIRPGLWGVVGRLEVFQNQTQFVVSEYRPITVDQYREHHGSDPVLPRAYTIDIETIALPDFKYRAPQKLKRAMLLGTMSIEQQQRYLEDPAAEEQRSYKMGALSATSGRILSIAVHIGLVPGTEIEGIPKSETEHVFGLDSIGEEDERQALAEFVALMESFDSEMDEMVGHNIIGFDLPFIFQRCLVNNVAVSRLTNSVERDARCVFDTMQRWWLGGRNRVSLDDLAWALGLQSSKTEEVEGSRVFDLYQAGRLAEIREYNLNDVRLTRQVYERMIAIWGR